MPMPLEGIRVLEWSQWQAGPSAGVMLADIGAEVVKFERPDGGDQGRRIAAVTGGLNASANGRECFFEANNRNKRSLTLDLHDQRGRQIAYQLVAKSDIFLHNFIQSTVEGMGMEYDRLAQFNPKLIYVELTGYGPEGPESGERASDLPCLARSGLMYQAGEPDMPPQYVVGGVGDQIGSIMAAYGVLAALLARDRLGIGQKVDASILGSLVWVQQQNVAMRLMGGQEMGRRSRGNAASAAYNYYRCGDGKWLVLASHQQERYWPRICQAMGLEGDPRFTNPDLRKGIVPELISHMDEVFLTKPRFQWLELFKLHGVIAGPMNDFADMVEDPQVLANGYIMQFDHPAWGRVGVAGLPIRLNATPGQIRTAAPELGANSEEILRGVLGYSSARLAELRADHVV